MSQKCQKRHSDADRVGRSREYELSVSSGQRRLSPTTNALRVYCPVFLVFSLSSPQWGLWRSPSRFDFGVLRERETDLRAIININFCIQIIQQLHQSQLKFTIFFC